MVILVSMPVRGPFCPLAAGRTSGACAPAMIARPLAARAARLAAQ
ncbi:hypothetical protein [Mesorhizobium australafricanum]|uniref:Uncharacterized protein n=1 Tax=Mesorhizobium australafricanum TaxID=3072311 RepID=A0ABU4X4L8_9HYPH|nr:hypothetical protein [Mesorhizobium sp. VK3E]MDX8443282.1 hypothetical protein [Mesorhizobium sp. VK3E]